MYSDPGSVASVRTAVVSICFGACAFVFGDAQAAGFGELEIQVTEAGADAVEHAVVVAYGAEPAGRAEAPTAVIDQVDKTFVPHVLAVETGTRVDFPNSDNIRHHVYSFSEAKSFELPLYKGRPAEPVLFDQPGVVALGCNIHDVMSAYIYVADSPYLAVSGEDGIARLADLPAGNYQLRVWHPRLENGESSRALEVSAGDSVTIQVQLELKPDVRIPRGPATRRRRY